MYQIIFIAKLEGASEQSLVVNEKFLQSQLRILMDSDYKILKVKCVEDGKK